MSLYVPPAFACSSPEEARALIHTWPFATLITTTAGEPHITHLPLLLEGDVLTGHMARANPHWQAFATGHTVAVFHGPHAYITPNWYVNPSREVPTWNYATVHVHGAPLLIESAEEKLRVVDATSTAFEDPNNPWTRAVDDTRLEALLRGIVAFTLPLARIDAKFKMNQNKTAADRVQVMSQLRASAHPDLIVMADWMQQHERP